MAQRDRSQGFGFVYANLSKILGEREAMGAGEPQPVPAGQTLNFNKDPLPADSSRERNGALQQIRENLDRLQSLHHKLHTMLEDLNKLTHSEKKRKN